MRIELQLGFGDLFPVHLGNRGRADETADDGFHPKQGENGDDQADNDFGDYALGIVSDILQHSVTLCLYLGHLSHQAGSGRSKSGGLVYTNFPAL